MTVESLSALLIVKKQHKVKILKNTFLFLILSFLLYNAVFFISLITFGLEIQKIIKEINTKYKSLVNIKYKLHYSKRYTAPGILLKDFEINITDRSANTIATLKIPTINIVKNNAYNVVGLTDIKVRIDNFSIYDGNIVNFFDIQNNNTIYMLFNKYNKVYRLRNLSLKNLVILISNSEVSNGVISIDNFNIHYPLLSNMMSIQTNGYINMHNPSLVSYALSVLLSDQITWNVDALYIENYLKQNMDHEFIVKDLNLQLGKFTLNLHGKKHKKLRNKEDNIVDFDISLGNYQYLIQKIVNLLMFYDKPNTKYINHLYKDTLNDIIRELQFNSNDLSNPNVIKLKLLKKNNASLATINSISIESIANNILNDYRLFNIKH